MLALKGFLSKFRPTVLVLCFLVLLPISQVPSTGSLQNIGASSIFSFGAPGDFGTDGNFSNIESVLSASGINFFLAPGDLSYCEGISTTCPSSPEQSWCTQFKTAFNNVEIVLGNHDTNESGGSTKYWLYQQYCPYTLSSPINYGPGPIPPNSTSLYGIEYYFDYPAPPSAPLMRFIMVTPDIAGLIKPSYCYSAGCPAYNWVSNTIDGARAADIPWVAVAMHKVCLSAGIMECDIGGAGFWNLLLNKKVDLILQAHEHNYERSKQLVCATDDTYLPSCVASTGYSFVKGAGTVIVIDGTGGRNNIFPIDSADPDYPYFASTQICPTPGSVTCVDHGFMKYVVTSTTLSANFVVTGGNFPFQDSFSISSTAVGTSSFLNFVRNPSTPLMLGHTEPEVVKVGDTFFLYYRNDSTLGASISVMSSANGLTWTERGTVLTKSTSGWDSLEVIAPSVLIDNGTYYLYYEAADASNPSNRAIGFARSSSPTAPFTKYFGNPILRPSLSWETTIVGTPVVTKIGALYYLFYHGFNGARDQVGVAYSDSPVGPWSKEVNNPILTVGTPGTWDNAKVAPSSVYVLQNSTTWLFYEGFNGANPATQSNWRIGLAIGIPDPTGRIEALTRELLPIFNLGPPGNWDNNTVQLPSVISVGTELWMYYSGQDGLAFGLGRAVAQLGGNPPSLPPPARCFLCWLIPANWLPTIELLTIGSLFGLLVAVLIFRKRRHRKIGRIKLESKMSNGTVGDK